MTPNDTIKGWFDARQVTESVGKVSSTTVTDGCAVAAVTTLATRVAAAHEPGTHCSRGGSPAIAELVALIEHLHSLGITLAVPLAAFFYVVAGLSWMRGTIEAQERAKRMFINTTVGLAIVLLSRTLIEIVLGPLCGVGP